MKLTGFNLKIIAIIAMTIDHIGHLLFPEMFWMRIIGRIAFPIFAYLVAEGFFYTKSKDKYILRMLFFALVAQVPYYMAFGFGLNIFFTFLIAITILRLKEKLKIPEFIIISLALLTIALISDWGVLGVFYVLAFYRFRDNKKKQIGSFILITLIRLLSIYIENGLAFIILVQSGVLLAIPFFYSYNGKRGKNLKYLFYLYYPLHIIILYFIAKIM